MRMLFTIATAALDWATARGYGFSREYPVERVYRDIRGLCIGAGTVEVQRNFIGKNVLDGSTPASHGWR